MTQLRDVANERSTQDQLDRALEVLHLFREFVIQNATQWQMGAGVCHHPMYELVAETLGVQNDKKLTIGEQLFIRPTNREKSLSLFDAVEGAADG